MTGRSSLALVCNPVLPCLGFARVFSIPAFGIILALLVLVCSPALASILPALWFCPVLIVILFFVFGRLRFFACVDSSALSCSALVLAFRFSLR